MLCFFELFCCLFVLGVDMMFAMDLSVYCTCLLFKLTYDLSYLIVL